MINLPARERLIVALDFDTEYEALDTVNRLGETAIFYKVGWQLFFGSHFDTVRALRDMNKKVFLDLKMTDIPATIQKAIKNAPKDSVDFLELMTLEGVSDMVQAARNGATGAGALKFLMLTVLSSMDDQDIKELYGNEATLEKIIRFKAKKALDAKCHGLIASGESVRELRQEFGDDFIIVTPGIRPEGCSADDHKRSLTPYEAITAGADYLVVGRPITQSDDPKGTAEGIISEIERALDQQGRGSGGNSSDSFSPMLRAAG